MSIFQVEIPRTPKNLPENENLAEKKPDEDEEWMNESKLPRMFL